MRNTADVMSGVQKERPNFGPKQIRDPDKLWVGRKVVEVELSGQYKKVITIEKAPYQDEEGNWWINVSWKSKEERYEEMSSLSDHNVKPYDNGMWNRTNCFKRRFLLFPWI